MSDLVFKHQSLCVADVDRSAAFYVTNFGYQIAKRQNRNGVERAVLQRPDHTLQLMSGEDIPALDWRCHLAFVSQQFDQMVSTLPHTREPYRLTPDGPRILFAHDPDGYPIEIVEHQPTA